MDKLPNKFQDDMVLKQLRWAIWFYFVKYLCRAPSAVASVSLTAIVPLPVPLTLFTGTQVCWRQSEWGERALPTDHSFQISLTATEHWHTTSLIK